MDTREILQIVLGAIVVLIVLVTGVTIYTLTRDAQTIIVKEVVPPGPEASARANPWEDKVDAAIALVRTQKARTAEGAEDARTIGEIVEEESFSRERLKLTSARKSGWQGQWWGDTRHGPSYFLVRYGFEDAHVTIGPAWLVDLKSRTVVPKNVWAQVAQDPARGTRSPYFDKAQQVVSAITRHRFDGGINLGGALLLYFDQRATGADGDTILGWTIEHDRGQLFKAWFQWVEKGEPTYAEFDFDFDARALKPVNLQASQIMRIGEEYNAGARVSILPASFDPTAKDADRMWTGPARQSCQEAANRERCKALSTLLKQNELMEALEWLLTSKASAAKDFEACKESRKCAWVPKPQGEGVFRIEYTYEVGQDKRTMSWDVTLKNGQVQPMDRTSQLAYRAVSTRG